MSQYVTLTDLEDGGLTQADVRERCPWAVEYTDLDGRPFWLHEELASLLGDLPEEDRP